MQLRAAFVVTVAALVPVLVACNDDGRTLRPARPDQVGSVSTLAPVTEPTGLDAFDDGLDGALDTISLDTVSLDSSPSLTQPDAAGSSGSTESGVLAVYSSFEDGQPIPVQHTCQGAGVSPVLTWSPAPADTVEIAITMVDLDAPNFIHWVMAAIDPASLALGEGVVPEFAIEGLNGTNERGYTGPCPPVGENHTYRITVHYLRQQTELADGSPGADLLAAIETSTLASASITGTYSQS